MLDIIIQFDQEATEWLAALLPHNVISDFIFSFLSLKGLTLIFWLILFVLFWRNERKNKSQHHFLPIFILSFALTSFFVNIVFKNIFKRIRPWVANGIPNHLCPSDFSFPSGHASLAFAGAVVFSYFDKKRRWLYYGIAILISYSRIYLGCHYGIDVIFGALFGFFLSKAIIFLLTGKKVL